jgi:hypothetical protein
VNKYLPWPHGLSLAFLFCVSFACKGSSGDDSGSVTDPLPEFQCQYSLVKDDRELLKQAHDRAVAGENLESLLKHAEKCLSETPSP